MLIKSRLVSYIQAAFYSIKYRGINVLRSPEFNKGLGFSWRERHLLGIHGLLPPGILTQEEQMSKIMMNLRSIDTDLNRYSFLMSLQERNEKLFFRVLTDNMEYCLPLIYTPTVGLACQKYGQSFKSPRGIFISIHDKNFIERILNNWPVDRVKAIVVTDGERILGLGDLGACGMGIPVGKLNLYTALAGIRPEECLPILLDVGTDNEELLSDPFYIGMKHKRIRGKNYDDFIDMFMQAIVNKFGPHTLIQFEDFGNHNAFKFLEKYRNTYTFFNDDIQGTASVVVSGLMTASRITQRSISDTKYLFFGAGEAAIGIANLLVKAMMDSGLSKDVATEKIFLADKYGLIVESREQKQFSAEVKPFVKNLKPTTDMVEILEIVGPNAVIGATGAGKIFSQEFLTKMGTLNERPIIFALSNPTSKAECTAEEAYRCTQERCIFASGSPFDPVEMNGNIYHTGQGNNAYIFPGVALAVVAAGIRPITDDIFLLAAKSLAKQVGEDDFKVGRIYPRLNRLIKISPIIASDVMSFAYGAGYASFFPEPLDKLGYLRRISYDPEYANIIPEPYPQPRLI